jgi:hypothetical protein
MRPREMRSLPQHHTDGEWMMENLHTAGGLHVEFPGDASLHLLSWEWRARLSRQESKGSAVQENKPRTGLHFLLLGHTCTSKETKELVKDECQELIYRQSHRESTAGSTLLVAEPVVIYRLSSASITLPHLGMFIDFWEGVWALGSGYLSVNVPQIYLDS